LNATIEDPLAAAVGEDFSVPLSRIKPRSAKWFSIEACATLKKRLQTP